MYEVIITVTKQGDNTEINTTRVLDDIHDVPNDIDCQFIRNTLDELETCEK